MHVTDRSRQHGWRPQALTAAAAAIATIALAGCSTHPVLYSNAHLEQVGEAQRDTDIADCEARAKEYVKSGGAAGKATVAGATGGAVGAAAGAAGGAAWGGHAGRGAAAGAAGGATAGVLHSLIRSREPSAVHKNFVTQCLAERGYHVLGWE
jgi:hypothetical protein